MNEVPTLDVHGNDDDIQGLVGDGIDSHYDVEEDVPVFVGSSSSNAVFGVDMNASLNEESVDNEEQNDPTTEPG